jgi:hypothetical protein
MHHIIFVVPICDFRIDRRASPSSATPNRARDPQALRTIQTHITPRRIRKRARLPSNPQSSKGSCPDILSRRGSRLQRVFFLTDMESSQSDEDAVLALARLHARPAAAAAAAGGGGGGGGGGGAGDSGPSSAGGKRRRSAPDPATQKLAAAASPHDRRPVRCLPSHSPTRLSPHPSLSPTRLSPRPSLSPTRLSPPPVSLTRRPTAQTGRRSGGGDGGGGGGGGWAAPAYVTVVGIGVDLSVATVEAVSAIPGAR